MIRRTVLFSGRVQGVGFRYTACRVAAEHQVTGYVRNLADGRVEAVVEGEQAEIERFVRSVGEAMPGYIQGVTVSEGVSGAETAATGEFGGFEVRF